MKDFKDKVVVITGGATGLGKAMADKFGEQGAKVVICARRENRLQEAVEDMKLKGIDARYKVCDVSNLEDVKALADFAWDEFGQVDVLVNNAGIAGIPEFVVDSSEASYQGIFKVNIFGILNGIWAFGKRIIEQGTPAMILNVHSETGLYVPGPMMGSYAASKYAGKAISESLRMEVPDFIEVGSIFPGVVQSELGGSTAMTQIGMPVDDFIDIIWPQIENGDFYIVSHPCAKDYTGENAKELSDAFDKYAPHYEGDEKYDSRWLAKQMME